MTLPESFIAELETVLGKEDTQKYLSLFEKNPYRGISINRLKTTPEKLLPLLPFSAEGSPFYRDGYYIPSDADGVGNNALHHAGAFYVQEPSASSAVSLLEIEPGEYVLDLCAAPGGKSSQIASMLNNTGLIWSNEVVRNRAGVLLSNFERMGISHGVVSSCRPEVLCQRLEGCFDKVLADAPCSGEGMFRKDNDAVTQWSREHVIACANRQISILQSAARCVREGGILVYSTCTFSPEENEETAEKFLELCPDFEPYDITELSGRKTRLSNAVRITPVEGGEGHFAVRFRRKGSSQRAGCVNCSKANNKEEEKLAGSFLEDIFRKRPDMVLGIRNGKIYLLPHDMPPVEGLGVIRAGVLAGEFVKKRIEPAHALFSSFRPDHFRRVLDLSLDDSRLDDYLRGLEIDCDGEPGYTCVSVEGISLGFGKCSGGRLKNKYPKGLRKV